VFEIHSPLDGRLLGSFEDTPFAQLIQDFDQARKAFPQWSHLPLKERLTYLKKTRQAFVDHIEELVESTHQEIGKVLPEIYGGEIVANLELFDFYLKHAPKILQDEPVPINPINYPGKKGTIQHRPLGVVGVLSSWNYPVAVALRAIVPALVSGNCVAFKASEQATLVGRVITKIFQTALPPHVFFSAYGGPAVSETIIDHADKINFIGSVAVGKIINQRCAARLIPCSTELSGKDAAIVLKDCNLERALNGIIWGAFTNSGQNCASIERVYIEKDIYEDFVKNLVPRVQQLQPKRDFGPLRTEKQLDLTQAHVQNAQETGNRILTGGKRMDDSLYFEPTVMEIVNDNIECIREETFGPTLPLIKVQDVHEAIAKTNAAHFGLTTSLWTQNIKAAKEWTHLIDTGVVMINNCVFTGALTSSPWGGTKDTGHGVTNSKYGLLEMTRPHFVLVDTSKGPKEAWWYPYSDDLISLMKTVTLTLSGKLSAYLKLLPLLKKNLKRNFN
jgi:acyl-CoA reductase-like NAD-dependent aldehyde dehydrogenase